MIKSPGKPATRERRGPLCYTALRLCGPESRLHGAPCRQLHLVDANKALKAVETVELCLYGWEAN